LRGAKAMAFLMAGGGAPRPQINVTPLIDVLLVLIIVFMVVESMSKRQGLYAEIPQPAQQTSEPPPVRTIVIEVEWNAKNNVAELKINQKEVAWKDLEPQLRDIFKQRAERVAFVKGGDDVDFEYVADVIDAAREAGVDRVGLLTKE
ncbi:MAG TPA: biopolymer transporter ExbD, partial [Terriglobales bacterium]|nr:biopolymer transporter ExbD [Terriglobales bacterium]